jgi:hypothetical protein
MHGRTNTGPFTISAWANPAVCHGTARVTIFSKYLNQEANTQGRAYSLHTANGTGNWALTMDPLAFAGTGTTATITEYVADGPCNADQWTLVVGRYNSNGSPPTPDATGAESTKLWLNDSPGNTGFTATHQPVSVGISSNVYIGRLHNVERFMRGAVDELRVSNVERSDNWNRLDYELQRTGGRAIFVGVVPPLAVAPGAKAVPGFAIRPTGSSVRFFLPAGMSGVRFSVVDPSGRLIWAKEAPSGVRELTWDGTTRAGSRAIPGGYVVRVMTGGTVTAESKVVMLR